VAHGLYISHSPFLALAPSQYFKLRVLFTVSSSCGHSYAVVLYVNAFLWMDGRNTHQSPVTGNAQLLY
jgi:hypothetical protein